MDESLEAGYEDKLNYHLSVIIQYLRIKDFQHKDADAINDGRQKNSLSCIIAVSIDINGKQHSICQQG